jgi:hypothetical protein
VRKKNNEKGMGMGAARKNKAKGYKQTTSIKRELV